MMPEFDLQAARMLWAPQIRPNGGLVEQIINQRFTDYMDNWRYGLLQQEAGVNTGTNVKLMDIDEADLEGSAQFGVLVTHILAQRVSASTVTATVSFGTNSASFNDWHAGIDLSGVANGEWCIIYPFPDSDGYGNDTPAGAVRKVRTVDTSNDEFHAALVSGTWTGSFDFYLYGFYWREAAT